MTASDLSPRDRDVLEQLLAGKRIKEIPTLTLRRVTAEVIRIKKRVGARTLMQLGAWAALQGIKPSGVI